MPCSCLVCVMKASQIWIQWDCMCAQMAACALDSVCEGELDARVMPRYMRRDRICSGLNLIELVSFRILGIRLSAGSFVFESFGTSKVLCPSIVLILPTCSDQMLSRSVPPGMGLISSEEIKRLTVICVIHRRHMTAGLFAALSVSVMVS